MADKRELLNAVNDIVMSFPSNTVCKHIAKDDFSDKDCSWMVHAARTGGTLYLTMYDTAWDKV